MQPAGAICSGMPNPYGITLDSASIRWAAAEGVPEVVIAATRLLHERSADEIASKLRPDELEKVVTGVRYDKLTTCGARERVSVLP